MPNCSCPLDEAVMDLGRGESEEDRAASGGRSRDKAVGCALAVVVATALWGPASAETVGGALVKAYLNNPDINQQRAAVRVADENVPKANAGYLPQVAATANAAVEHTNSHSIFATGTQSSAFD